MSRIDQKSTDAPITASRNERRFKMIGWIIVGILLLFVLWQAFVIKTQYRKLNSLNEYTQFLLFNPEVYRDHRSKFFDFLRSVENQNSTSKAMMSYQVIEDIATKLNQSILLANTVKREDSDDVLSSVRPKN